MPAHTFFRVLRGLSRVSLAGGIAGAVGAAFGTARRYQESIEGQDAFAQHTRRQRQKHFVSGMDEPLIPSEEQQLFFKKYFSEFSHLLPTSAKVFREQQALRTPVRIRPLSECPVEMDLKDAGTLAVGGPPALISAAAQIETTQNVTFLNDGRRWPIGYGSALHLEHDAPSEAPTSYMPSQFLFYQILRAVYNHESYEQIQRTGHFPWRTLDWAGWIKHPDQWLIGLRVGLAFQWATMAGKEQRQRITDQVARECLAGEKFYDALNKKMDEKLLLPGNGSIIVARTEEEAADLNAMKEDLAKEGRVLKILTKQEMIERFGFAPEGVAYGEKLHDRVLSPHYNKLLTGYIQEQGGSIVDGTLTTVYTDKETSGGVAEYRNANGQRELIPFSQLIMSLGNQPIFDHNDRPLFDVVAARGVSVLARVTVPVDYQLPPVTVCGGTNHMTKLSSPVEITGEDGRRSHSYLVRITAGACITANVSAEDSADYDSTIAVGLVSAARHTLGEQCMVDTFAVYGCNRQVSQRGQLSWINPFSSVHVQYGAGGGGLTRAPDFSTRTRELSEDAPHANMGMSR